MPIDIELKSALDSLQGETKTIFQDLATKHDELEKQHKALQIQVDAMDAEGRQRHVAGGGIKSLKVILEENDGIQRLMRDKKGSVILNLEGDDAALLERKTAVTEAAVGAQTTGVLQIDRIGGIVEEARQELTVRDMLTSRPTALGYVDWVKVNSPMQRASPQVEASDKFENAVTFLPVSEKIRTLATWIPASRQLLDDMNEMAGFLDTSLRYYVDLAEELQLLSGDGTGENLHGLIPQATSFNTALLSAAAGWTRIDIIARAIQQLAMAKEFTPTFAAMNPVDWWSIRLTKNSLGEYILGDPQSDVAPRLFTLRVVPTNNVMSGTFLVGSGNAAAAEIRDRMQTQVEISTQHSDYFAKNLVAIRAEKRLLLAVKRPAAYISGSFTTSPVTA